MYNTNSANVRALYTAHLVAIFQRFAAFEASAISAHVLKKI
jgi:hypothetical protein